MNKPELQHYICNEYKNGNKIFVTSDLHAYHKNLCFGSTSWRDKDKCRKFDNEFDMTSQLITNFNSVVGEKDIIIHCGDLCFGGASNVPKLMGQFVCKNWIHLFGNHENHTSDFPQFFLGMFDYFEIVLNKQFYVFFHYPIGSWNNMSRGSICCVGHSHGNYFHEGKSKDVGVDTNNLFPYDIDDVKLEMDGRSIVSKDHH